MSSESNSTGSTLKAARRAKKITQLAMAELLGVNVRTYRNWEAGRTVPRLTLPKYQLLAEELELSLDEVVKLFERPDT